MIDVNKVTMDFFVRRANYSKPYEFIEFISAKSRISNNNILLNKKITNKK